MRILQFTTDSRPDSLGRARRRVRNALVQAGIDAQVVGNMEAAVGEALANVHDHAYAGGLGSVSATVFKSAGCLTAVISDDGRGTVAPSGPDVPHPSTSLRGRGLYVMGHLMDDVAISVNPAGHGLTVRMTARL
jgi:serine/threonine-protein kinase RsbW